MYEQGSDLFSLQLNVHQYLLQRSGYTGKAPNILAHLKKSKSCTTS